MHLEFHSLNSSYSTLKHRYNNVWVIISMIKATLPQVTLLAILHRLGLSYTPSSSGSQGSKTGPFWNQIRKATKMHYFLSLASLQYFKDKTSYTLYGAGPTTPLL